ncbi:hypothetical protein ETR14_21725 [Sphingosinicella sp. BN140058]|nr:hypothetical protein ETR14_21725 [Sphingosinicella sp. BN140058]
MPQPGVAAAAPSPVVPIAAAPIAAVPPVAPDPFEEEASLRPGKFLWAPERASAGPVEIVVSIPLQRAFVYRGGSLIGVSTVSTGKPGHRTPVGTFDILEKRREHYSNKYNNAPMPFMQRLTWDGVALHAGQIPGHPASHGCIRLPKEFARLLFGVTKVGASVHVIELSPAAGEALAMVRGDGQYNGMGGPLEDVAGN